MTENARLREAEALLRDIAWHVSDHASVNWSGPDLVAHIADYFQVTTADLLESLEADQDD